MMQREFFSGLSPTKSVLDLLPLFFLFFPRLSFIHNTYLIAFVFQSTYRRTYKVEPANQAKSAMSHGKWQVRKLGSPRKPFHRFLYYIVRSLQRDWRDGPTI